MGLKKNATLFSAIANTDVHVAANCLFEFVTTAKERALYLQNIPYPLSLEVLKLLPDNSSKAKASGQCSEKDFLILECLKKEGLKAVFKLNALPQKACPYTESVLEQVKRLPNACCRLILTESSLSSHHKNFFLRNDAWSEKFATEGLLELFSEVPFDTDKIQQLTAICKDIDESLVSNLLKCAHPQVCINIVKCIPSERIRNAVTDKKSLDLKLVAKLPAKTFIDSITNDTNELFDILYKLTGAHKNQLEQEQFDEFIAQCILFLVSNRTQDKLTQMFDRTYPPITKMLAKLMYQSNKPLLIDPDKHRLEIVLDSIYEDDFENLIGRLPADAKTKVIELCLRCRPKWLPLLPANIFNEQLELDEELLLLFAKHFSALKTPLHPTTIDTINKLAWQRLSDSAKVSYLMRLRGKDIEAFLSCHPQQFRGFTEIPSIMQVVNFIELLEEPRLSRFIGFLPKDSLKLLAYYLINEKNKPTHAATVISLHPEVLSSLDDCSLSTLFSERKVYKTPLHRVIQTLPRRIKDDQLLAKVLLTITPPLSVKL